MSTTIEKNHEQCVAGLEAEIRDLEARIKEAKTSAEEASNRLINLSRAMDEISPSILAGDEDSRLDLLALEEESSQYERQQRVARAALDAYQSELAQKKQELRDARKEAARGRYDALLLKLAAPEERAEEAARELVAAKKEHRKIYEAALEEAEVFSDRAVNDARLHYGPPQELVRKIRWIMRPSGLL
jgi:DNA repair exonuclease SbcCD ATPase subunit